MKKILLSLAAVGAIAAAAAAAPATAQPWNAYDRYDGYRDAGRPATPYIDSLDWKVINAAQQGRLRWDAARELRREISEVRPIAWRMQYGQANHWEAARLQRTIYRVEQAVDNRGWRDGGYDQDRDDGDHYDGWRR